MIEASKLTRHVSRRSNCSVFEHPSPLGRELTMPGTTLVLSEYLLLLS